MLTRRRNRFPGQNRNFKRNVGSRLRIDPDKVEEFEGTGQDAGTTIVSGTSQLAYQLTATAGFMGARWADLLDNFRYFRLIELRVTFCRSDPESGGGISGAVAVGFSSAQVTAPTTFDAVCGGLSKVAYSPAESTVPRTLTLTREDLRGVCPWYVTEASAGEVLLDTQGTIFSSVSDGTTGLARATVLQLFFQWKVQCKGALAPAVSFDNRLQHLTEEEREVLRQYLEDHPEDGREDDCKSAFSVISDHVQCAGGDSRPPTPRPQSSHSLRKMIRRGVPDLK